MLNYQNNTLAQYLDHLSRREPVPGGGSAAALTAALGVALIAMVASYSKGRKANSKATEKRLAKILTSSETMRKRLLQLTTLDAKAYLKIIAARKGSAQSQKQASRAAAAIGKEVGKLCYKALDLAPFLVAKGNPYLISDIEVAVELLEAGFNGSMVMVRINR